MPPASASTDARSSPEQTSYTYSLDAWLTRTGQHTPEQDSERWVSYNIDDLYPDWQSQAHCAGVGVSYYFGDEDEQPTMSIRQVRAASKLCEVCPVYLECLTWALTKREEYGVWAGTSGRMRRRIFKLVDNGHTTVAEVVERFLNGQGDTYRHGDSASTKTRSVPSKAQGDTLAVEAVSGLGEGDPGLRPEMPGELAL